MNDTRKVIDKNMFEAGELDRFLACSRKHIAVIPDIASVEAFVIGDYQNVIRTFGTLCRYSEQVCLMKPTRKLIHLAGRSNGLSKRLVDDSATKELSGFCRGISRLPTEELAEGMRIRRNKALEIRDYQLEQSEKIAQAVRNFQSSIPDRDLNELRRNHRYTHDLLDRLIRDVLWISAGVYSRSNIEPNMPFAQLINTWVFRFSLSVWIHAVHRIEEGGAISLGGARFRNDVADLVYVTSATYFDGLMTNDSRPAANYAFARTILSWLEYPKS